MDWTLALTVFSVIFVAELPDKTAFATVVMATQHDAWGIFVGAAGAFVVQSIVAVSLGTLLHRLPAHPVHLVAASLFLIFAVMMWRKKVDTEEQEEERALKNRANGSFLRATAMSFGVIFLAEWGDLTQLATATFAAKYHEPLTIFASATLALWFVTALTATIGHHAKRVLPQKLFQKIAAVAFAVVGAILLIRG
jgi:putative Ca2+/H+ antiporter (TMEM165/GDT1 family)